MDIIKYLPPHIKDFVVCIIKTGSQLFCANCKDSDYLIITKEFPLVRAYHINELKADCFLRSIDEFKAEITDDKWRYKLCACLAYQNPENVVYGELPTLETDIFSRDYLLKVSQMEYEHAKKTYFIRYPSKAMVWGLALRYVLENESFIFTDEQKALLQQCHDLELPETHRDQLKIYLEQLNTTE